MPSLSAIVTAFHPDERLETVVTTASKTCAEVIVVDNTPSGEASSADTLTGVAGVRVVRGGRNLGLAGALNAGVRELSADTEMVLLLDQDSVLDGVTVDGLAALLEADASVGIAAPAPWDATRGRYYEPGTDQRPDVAERDTVITSGMLVRRSVLDAVGTFREEFFVDHVDNDFCLRARMTGARIVQDKRLKLVHSLGVRETRRVPGAAVSVSTSRHPVWRNYWYARNATILVREHRRDARAWSRGQRRYLVQWFAVRLLLEPARGRRAAAILRGFADGRRGLVRDSYYPAGASRPERITTP